MPERLASRRKGGASDEVTEANFSLQEMTAA